MTCSEIDEALEVHIARGVIYYEYDIIILDFLLEIEKSKLTEKDIPIIKWHIRYLSKEGYLFPKIIVSAYYRGDLSYGELCRSLNLKSKYIGSIERAVML